MTPDRLKNALLNLLAGAKPDVSIAVSDAQSFADVALPRLTVGIDSTETHSATLPGVYKMQLSIELRAHAADTDTRTTVEGWCDELEQFLNDPDTLKLLLTQAAKQARVDHWLCGAGVPEWDDDVLVVAWEAECWAVRTG